jgi:hypothetical protein
MEPETRFAITLGASLVLWVPSLLGIVDGEVELGTGLAWYVVGLIAAWLAVAGLDRLLTGYYVTNEARSHRERAAAAREALGGSRSGEATDAAGVPVMAGSGESGSDERSSGGGEPVVAEG